MSRPRGQGPRRGDGRAADDGNTSHPGSPDSREIRLRRRLFSHSALAAVVAAWPELPEAIRAGIMAMVKAASGEGRAGS
jgi:hypothetical protein